MTSAGNSRLLLARFRHHCDCRLVLLSTTVNNFTLEQGKVMEVLVIVETNIHDANWVKTYLSEVTPIVKLYGGGYLTRTSAVELLEGDSKPQYSIVAKFPSKRQALAFYHSAEYAPYKEARQGGSSSRFLLVPLENGSV